MSLISILISLAIESYWAQVDKLRQFDWFDKYSQWMMAKLESLPGHDSPVGVFLVLLPLAVVVWGVNAMLGGILGLLSFAFGIVVLLFCLGPRTLPRDAHAYLDAAEAEDDERARDYASHILGRPVDEQPQQLADCVKRAILIQTNDRIIAVMFWFALLGPVGAVLYRFGSLLTANLQTSTERFKQSANQLFWLMNWLPTRITILGYALAGNFIDTTSYWRSVSDFWTRDSHDLLVASGIGALRQDVREDIERDDEKLFVHGVAHALALAKRTTIVFITALALMTLAGWLI